MKTQLLAFTTNVISFKRENVCLVSSLEKIKEKGINNLLSFSHPLLKEDLLEYLKQYLSFGTNHFDLGENTLLTFYEESDELRYNRFKRTWNLKPTATFVKEKKYCISSQYLNFHPIEIHASKSPGENICLDILRRVPTILLNSLHLESLYEDVTSVRIKDVTVKFYTKLD